MFCIKKITGCAILFGALVLSSCGGSKHQENELKIDLNDGVTQQIYNFRDKRGSKELISYLTSENPVQRYLATLAFCSVQDPSVIDDLALRLKDENQQVRCVAALALGLTKSPNAVAPLLNTFAEMNKDSLSDTRTAAEIIAALGRVANRKTLYQISTAGYKHKMTELLDGQSRAIYYFGLRDSVLAEGTRLMTELAVSQDVDPKVRLTASNYLFRCKTVDLTHYDKILADGVKAEQNPEIRMFLVVGLAKSRSNFARLECASLYNSEKDARVKCNLVRSFKYFPYDSISTVAFNALNDGSSAVQLSAADYFYGNGNDKDASRYSEVAFAPNMPWNVRARLLAASLRCISAYRTITRQSVSAKIIERYKMTNNVYEKAALLEAVGEFGWNYAFIKEEIFPTDTVKAKAGIPEPIKSAGITAIATILRDPNFNAIFGFGVSSSKKQLIDILLRGIQSGDVGMISPACEALVEPSVGAKDFVGDLTPLRAVLEKLTLPRDVEAYNDLEAALAYLSGVAATPRKANYTDPIEWGAINSLPPDAHAIVETSKGTFSFQLFKNEAPASVANFVKLAKSGFFNGKAFHRVVPNFVIQTGCARGDGYGGSERSLRTEIGTSTYNEAGMVGMASDGRDTEGTQWFVTHSPALHLTGNYTIFGKISDGMDVVQRIEIGDKIIKVEIR